MKLVMYPRATERATGKVSEDRATAGRRNPEARVNWARGLDLSAIRA
jgi:hypothetical protein